MVSPYYIVGHGPDSRHLIVVKVFNLKKEAEEFISKLAKNRAYRFEKHAPKSQWASGKDVKVTLIRERVI